MINEVRTHICSRNLLKNYFGVSNINFKHQAFVEHPELIKVCNEGGLCITMSFTLEAKNIHCHIIFVHDQQIDDLMSVVNAALTDLGLA